MAKRAPFSWWGAYNCFLIDIGNRELLSILNDMATFFFFFRIMIGNILVEDGLDMKDIIKEWLLFDCFTINITVII